MHYRSMLILMVDEAIMNINNYYGWCVQENEEIQLFRHENT